MTDVNRALRSAARELAASVPGLAHVRPARILFVYNPAVRARARILPLVFDATGTRLKRDGLGRRPLVRVDGRSMRYVVEYGRTFLRSPPRRRLETLVHELMHTSPFFNGTLSRAMRHGTGEKDAFKSRVRAAIAAVSGGDAVALCDFPAPIVCLKWRRPFSLSGGGVYSEKDLKRVRVRVGGRRSEVGGRRSES